MFDIGSGEMLVILVLALLLFGGSLPDVARNLGRSVGELKRSFSENTRPFREAQNDVEREVAEIGEEKARPARHGDPAKPGDSPKVDPPAGGGA